jgi:hypothetical protein
MEKMGNLSLRVVHFATDLIVIERIIMDFSAAVENAEMEVGPVLSLDEVRPNFQKYVVAVEQVITDAMAVTVTDDESLKMAVSLGGNAKKLAKALEAVEKEVTQEARDFVSSVQGFCDGYTERLISNSKKSNNGCVEAILKKRIGDYQYTVELERREQERKAQEATEALRKRLQAEADEANRKARDEAMRKAQEEAEARKATEAEIEAARKQAEEEAKAHEIQAPEVIAPVIPKQETITRTESGSSSYPVKRWVCTIVNPAEVPRNYCEPSKQLLDNAVKMGSRDIPGCRIEEITEQRFRA